jgi:hypothetical protein
VKKSISESTSGAQMASQTIGNGKLPCCRLCLASGDECVNIFKTQAADKQPIHTKISSCVQIQVS